MSGKKAFRRKLFAGLAVVAGVALLAFEFARPEVSVTRGERWFWVVVGAALVVLGAMELAGPSRERD